MAARSPSGGWSKAAALAAACATFALPSAARADETQSLNHAKEPFDAGQYGEAHRLLSSLLDASLPPCDASTPAGARCRLTSPELIERARAFDAASLLALKREQDADALMGAILRQNPDYLPSPGMFPQEVIDRFDKVRGSIAGELRAIVQQRAKDEAARRQAAQKAHEEEEKWIAEIQELAGKETHVEHNSRWIALVPFGIGQFQNGDVRLGIAFATGEAIFGGTSLIAVAIINNLAKTDITKRLGNNQPIDVPALNAEINTVTTVNRVAFAGWAALTIAGVLQAQIGFVPQNVTYKPRPVRPRPKLVPVASPVPGGAILGLTGTF